MYSKDQLEKPISSALANPIVANFFTLAEQFRVALKLPVTIIMINRTTADSKNFIIIWHVTTKKGK